MLQLGLAKNADLPDVPLASDLLNSADDRALLELLVTSTAIGRPLAAPPATPPDRVELLRRAFDATMTDPEFLDESRKLQSEISPTSGAEVQNIVARMYATPRSVVDRAKSLLPK
jgi:hypothetical protein